MTNVRVTAHNRQKLTAEVYGFYYIGAIVGCLPLVFFAAVTVRLQNNKEIASDAAAVDRI